MTPALAVIEQIRADHKIWDVIYIGRKFAMEGDRYESGEYRIIKKLGIPFYSLATGRVKRWISLESIVSLVKIPFGFIHAFWILLNIKPSLIVSFGGYIAVPVVIAGWVMGIPIITHEQTTRLGMGNRLISIFAKKVMVCDRKLVDHINGKFVFTGLPFRKALLNPPKSPSFLIDSSIPILYFSGGSTGAQSLNEYVYGCLPSLVKDFTIIHQTGARSFKRANEVEHTITNNLRGRYVIKPFFEIDDMAWMYVHSALIVGRAGANTVGEIAALGAVGLFIPLPWSGNNEQQQNAETLVSIGSSEIIPQHILSSEKLEKEIRRMILHLTRYRQNALSYKKNISLDGAEKIVTIIEIFIT